MAIGLDGSRDYAGVEAVRAFTLAAARPDTQYSYLNALIAEVDGRTAGVIVGYDGARLHTLRDASLEVIRQFHPDIEVPTDETEPGEFYLDSIGVLPEYRGRGIARRLIDAITSRAAAEGHSRFGLLVDFDNAPAERLYRDIGFTDAGQKPFFGHMMRHLQRSL